MHTPYNPLLREKPKLPVFASVTRLFSRPGSFASRTLLLLTSINNEPVIKLKSKRAVTSMWSLVTLPINTLLRYSSILKQTTLASPLATGVKETAPVLVLRLKLEIVLSGLVDENGGRYGTGNTTFVMDCCAGTNEYTRESP